MHREFLARMIREARAKNGLSVAEFAKTHGITASYVRYLERGKRQPALLLLFRMKPPEEIVRAFYVELHGEEKGSLMAEILLKQLEQIRRWREGDK